LKLHNEELHILYTSPDTGRYLNKGDRIGGRCSRYDGNEKYIQKFDRETSRDDILRKT